MNDTQTDREKSTRRWYSNNQLERLIDRVVGAVKKNRRRMAISRLGKRDVFSYFDKDENLPEGWRWF